ncbi:MAG TPA: SUKH-3 domain-containing protein [Clostridia bacterium]
MKESTIKLLKEAGWYPNRKIDITELVVDYEKNGFEMFHAAKSFIEEYGGLDINLSKKRPGVSEDYIEKFELKKFTLHTTNMTEYIIKGLTRDYVNEYEEEYIEEKLVAVGILADGHATLMISESGKMFTEYGFYGNSPEEFWDRLLNYDLATGWVEWLVSETSG